MFFQLCCKLFFILQLVCWWKPQGPEVSAGCIWVACWTVISCRVDAKGCPHFKGFLWPWPARGGSDLAVEWKGTLIVSFIFITSLRLLIPLVCVCIIYFCIQLSPNPWQNRLMSPCVCLIVLLTDIWVWAWKKFHYWTSVVGGEICLACVVSCLSFSSKSSSSFKNHIVFCVVILSGF